MARSLHGEVRRIFDTYKKFNSTMQRNSLSSSEQLLRITAVCVCRGGYIFVSRCPFRSVCPVVRVVPLSVVPEPGLDTPRHTSTHLDTGLDTGLDTLDTPFPDSMFVGVEA